MKATILTLAMVLLLPGVTRAGDITDQLTGIIEKMGTAVGGETIDSDLLGEAVQDTLGMDVPLGCQNEWFDFYQQMATVYATATWGQDEGNQLNAIMVMQRISDDSAALTNLIMCDL